ncbi:hypothetical protein V1478_017105 [Vespula squamosa]|uniref:Ribosomal protein L14 n=1 Tax=Vespula squamosa TaxID=30214 RepID=A0ABD1ZYZ4_VESSQ
MTLVEVARVIVSNTGKVYALVRGDMILVIRKFLPANQNLYPKRKLLVARKFLPANQNSYAGHMICEEVAPEIAPITGIVTGTHDIGRGGTSNCIYLWICIRPCKRTHAIGFSEISSRKSEFVSESHDLRGGRTRNQRKLLVTRKFLPANQNSYAGHMICEEVAPEIAPITD